MENINTVVVKRNGKKVDFDGTKIALAIKKGFDSVNPSKIQYTAEDANKIYNDVIEHIRKLKEEKIKIEEIQDIIEQKLKENNYLDVYDSFSKYRERRSQSRASFIDEKKLHKFLKSLENLGLESSDEEDNKLKTNRNSTGNSMEKLFQFGSTVSKEFSCAYLMKKDFSGAHDKGNIFIHDLEFFPLGTTDSCYIELDKLFENGFKAGNVTLREPQDIRSYSALAALAIQSNQNDQHGEQCIPAFDYYMATGVFKTFKKQFKQAIDDLLSYTDFDKFVAINGIERELNKLSSISFDIEIFDKFTRDSSKLKRLFRTAYDNAIKKTNFATYQAMEAFIHNLNNLPSKAGAQIASSSINLGTDCSAEGRMVIKNFLTALDTGIVKDGAPIFPITVFKVKDSINLNSNDPNYDLLQLAMQVALHGNSVNFSFLDASFNKDLYKIGDFNTEVAYMGCNTRVLDNIVSSDRAVTGGRGNLSTTTINLPRLGIKYGIALKSKVADLDGFFKELDEVLELVKNQLLERFELQSNKHTYNFPFLIQNGIWIDSEKLTLDDKLRRVLKYGNLGIGFTGLSECLKALTGKNHAESKPSQDLGLKIISHIRQKADEFSEECNLNFTVVAPSNEFFKVFTQMDKTIYGILPGITDKECYTSSFHIPDDSKVSIKEKIKLEAPYHVLTNGGHCTKIQLPSSEEDNIEKIIHIMQDNDIGYAIIKGSTN